MGELASSLRSGTKRPGGAGQLRWREAASPRLQPEQPPGLRRARERAGANAGPRFRSSARRSRAGPWPQTADPSRDVPPIRAALQPGRGSQAAALRSAGKPEAQGPGCKVRPAFFSEAAPAVSDSGRWLRARPGKGVGCTGRGPGSASRGGARGARFPGLAARPTPRGCSLMLPSAARTSRTRQTFPSLHVERLPRGSCAPASAEIRAT